MRHLEYVHYRHDAWGVIKVTERPHYANAPITEAIIDLKIVESWGLSIDDLATIRDLVMDQYPNQEHEHVYSGQVYVEGVGEPLRTDATYQVTGFRFTSRDKRQVFYARLDGFTLTVGAPYDRWETFRDEARRLWNIYRSVAKPEGVTRVEVRYINQLDVSANAPDPTNIELSDYLNVYPEAPDEWNFNNFFLQLQVPQVDLNCWLVVNEAPVRDPDREEALVQLDFDLFRERFEEPWRADDDTEVWGFLEQLHIRKNEVFEASITKKTRRSIR